MTVNVPPRVSRFAGTVPLTVLQHDLLALADEARAKALLSLSLGDALRAQIYTEAAEYYERLGQPG